MKKSIRVLTILCMLVLMASLCDLSALADYTYKFRPNDVCTKGEFVDMLWRLNGSPEPAEDYSGFVDFENDQIFLFSSGWAMEQGILAAVGENEFGVNVSVTRGMAVKALYILAGSPDVGGENPYTDVSAADADAVAWAKAQGITGGISESRFGFNTSVTRAQLILFIYKAQGAPKLVYDYNPFGDVTKSDWYYNAVAWGAENDLFYGLPRMPRGRAFSGTWGDNLSWQVEGDTLTISGSGPMADFSYDIQGFGDIADMRAVTKVVIEDGVTSVGEKAFYFHRNLTDAVLPDSVTAIGNEAFNSCTGLQRIHLPDSITSIGEFAFVSCHALESVSLPPLLTRVSPMTFAYCAKLTSVTIGSGVTSIGEHAFYSCPALTSVSLSDGLANIGSYAFWGCKSLKSISIPGSVDTVGDYAFCRCEGLESVTLGDGIKRLGEEAFWGCKALKSITIPDSVTAIGSYAFSSCTGLEEVRLSKQLTAIGDSCFWGCKALKSFTIPDGVKTIGSGAFYGCGMLAQVTLPASVTDIGDSAFANIGLETASYKGTAEQWYAMNIGQWNDFLLLNVKFTNPATSGKCGDNLTWSYSNGLLTISGTGEMWDYDSRRPGFMGLADRDKVLRVVLAEGVGSVGDYAFRLMRGLQSVTMARSITALGEGSFSGCFALKSLSLSSGITEIPKELCVGCKALKSITIPKSVTVIGEAAFDGCGGLTAVTLPENLAVIGDDAFQFTNISTISLPASVTSIGGGAFLTECGLKNVNYAGTKAQWAQTEMCKRGIFEDLPVRCRDGVYTKPVEIPPVGDTPFMDVAKQDYYHDPVKWAVENKVTSGLSATGFGPNADCTRAQVVTFLWRAKGEPEPQRTENPFTDVAEGQYYYKAVLWAVENGITNGVSATEFGTDAVCSRAQVATFLWRTMGKPTPTGSNNPFVDVAAGQYYYDAVLWAVEQGVTNGTSPTTFGPDVNCNRGQIVTFLYRTLA